MIVSVLTRFDLGTYHIDFHKTFHVQYVAVLKIDLTIDLMLLPFNDAINAVVNLAHGESWKLRKYIIKFS